VLSLEAVAMLLHSPKLALWLSSETTALQSLEDLSYQTETIL